MSATHWREGLEEVGHCPTCGVAVFVRLDPAAEAGALPSPVYLCACRFTAASQQWAWPTPSTPSTSPPVPHAPLIYPRPGKWVDDKAWESWNDATESVRRQEVAQAVESSRSQFDVHLDSFQYPA